MKGYVEKIINDYPKMVRERKRLREQLKSCNFLSAEELISTMCLSHPVGERVRNSNIADKTARVAIEYREKLEKINHGLIKPMQERYDQLDAEIIFLENEICNLPQNLSMLMKALVLEGMTWDEVERTLYVNRKTISETRKKAIHCLVRAYQIRASGMEAMLLS